MRTKTRTIALAVSAVFGATALALAGGMVADQGTDFGLIAAAYAKDEGGASGGHASGGGEKGGAEKGGAMGGAEKGGGHVSGGSSGGHTSGGAEKGGGHTSGGDSGHASGAKGSPHTESNRYGLERADHGTKAGHEGHASGVHGANAKHGGNVSTYYATGAVRTFGGGSGLASLEGVMEGPARFAPGSTLSVTETLQPGPKFSFRYWGGWAVPDDGGTGDGTVTPTIVDNTIEPAPVGGGGGPLAGLQLNSAARCDGVAMNMPTKSFYTNSNLTRLDAARVELDPEAIGSGRGLDPTPMANVQEALVDGKVDPVLVGAYLGMISRKPVTPEVVKRVAFRLCVPMDDATAQNIAQAANDVNQTASAD